MHYEYFNRCWYSLEPESSDEKLSVLIRPTTPNTPGGPVKILTLRLVQLPLPQLYIQDYPNTKATRILPDGPQILSILLSYAASTRCTCAGCHSPPREVLTPRAL